MPRIVKSIYKGHIVDLRLERHRLSQGSSHDFEVVRHVPAAAVLPIQNSKILMIRQYRAPLGKVIWEIPAGLIEKGETALACARRELIEETGYSGKNFKKLTEIYTTAGFSDEKIVLYRCDVGTYIGHDRETSEDIRIKWLPLNRVRNMLKSGRIADAKTIIALQYHLLYG